MADKKKNKTGCCDVSIPKIKIECGQIREISLDEMKERMIKNRYWLSHQAKKSSN